MRFAAFYWWIWCPVGTRCHLDGKRTCQRWWRTSKPSPEASHKRTLPMKDRPTLSLAKTPTTSGSSSLFIFRSNFDLAKILYFTRAIPSSQDSIHWRQILSLMWHDPKFYMQTAWLLLVIDHFRHEEWQFNPLSAILDLLKKG